MSAHNTMALRCSAKRCRAACTPSRQCSHAMRCAVIYQEPQLRVLEYRCASRECYADYASVTLGTAGPVGAVQYARLPAPTTATGVHHPVSCAIIPRCMACCAHLVGLRCAMLLCCNASGDVDDPARPAWFDVWRQPRRLCRSHRRAAGPSLVSSHCHACRLLPQCCSAAPYHRW